MAYLVKTLFGAVITLILCVLFAVLLLVGASPYAAPHGVDAVVGQVEDGNELGETLRFIFAPEEAMEYDANRTQARLQIEQQRLDYQAEQNAQAAALEMKRQEEATERAQSAMWLVGSVVSVAGLLAAGVRAWYMWLLRPRQPKVLLPGEPGFDQALAELGGYIDQRNRPMLPGGRMVKYLVDSRHQRP